MNYRIIDEKEKTHNCLFCKFSWFKNEDLICSKTNMKTYKNCTCDLWRYKC